VRASQLAKWQAQAHRVSRELEKVASEFLVVVVQDLLTVCNAHVIVESVPGSPYTP
jgi:hypothetical protein